MLCFSCNVGLGAVKESIVILTTMIEYLKNMTQTQRVFLASDLHLGHRKLVEIGKRPYGFEERFFKAWGQVVFPDDVIMLLGDIAMSTASGWFQRIQSMPGKKVLLLGNHDRNKLQWYEKFGFERVVPFGESLTMRHDYGNILFTHVPASTSVLATYDPTRFMPMARRFESTMDRTSSVLNVHGHCHGSALESTKTVDVSLEVIDYTPILLSQVIERKFK